MASNRLADPTLDWRKALGKLEVAANALANRGMKSEAMPQAIHQMFSLMLGMRHVFEQLQDTRAKLLDMPRRRDIAALAERLERVENKLDRLQPATPAPAHAKPARTRRPAGGDGAAPQASPAADAPSPQRRKARPAARRPEKE